MSAPIAEILKALPLFKSLDAKELAALVALTRPQPFAAQQAMLVEGKPAAGLFVLLHGKVSVNKGADTLCELDEGECVGEVEIIDGSPCAASVVCQTPVEAAVIRKDYLEAFFAAQPAAAYKILRQMVRLLASRLRRTNQSYATLKRIAESMGD